jgi:putative hydrolase of the HAD superfamily
MRYSAVIFDLFGTLVDEFPYEDYQSVLGQMASVLKVPFADFKRLWYETAHERNTGIMGFIEDYIECICRRLGTKVDDMQIRQATKIRYDFVADTIKPRPDAIDVLSKLRSRGLKIGLISNCSPETRIIWGNTSFPPLFDAVIFSSSVGVMKPDSHIYHLALDKLAVKPEDCLYIGDGDDQELTGAASVGMHPVMIRVSRENGAQPYLTNKEDWHGPVILSLKEVLTLVAERGCLRGAKPL